jgi:hypothetical protein
VLQPLGHHAQGKCLRIRARLLSGVAASRRLMGVWQHLLHIESEQPCLLHDAAD